MANSVTTFIQSPEKPESESAVSVIAHSSKAPYSEPNFSIISSDIVSVFSASQLTRSAATRII